MTWIEFPPFGNIGAALFSGNWAPGVERASGWRKGRTRDVTLENHPLASRFDLGIGHRNR